MQMAQHHGRNVTPGHCSPVFRGSEVLRTLSLQPIAQVWETRMPMALEWAVAS